MHSVLILPVCLLSMNEEAQFIFIFIAILLPIASATKFDSSLKTYTADYTYSFSIGCTFKLVCHFSVNACLGN